MIGAARIVPSADGTYRPDPAGQWAAICPVRNSNLKLVDCVAWHVEMSGRWWLRHGDECPLLGARQLAVARYFGEVIQLHSTPEDWLLALGRGVAILKWDVDYRDLFDGVARVECDSPALQERLRDALRRWEPSVTIKPSEVRRAA